MRKIFDRKVSDILEKWKVELGLHAHDVAGSFRYYLNQFKKEPIKKPSLLFIKDRGCNVPYLELILKLLSNNNLLDYKTVALKDYIHFDHDSFDLLIYQTWSPDDNYSVDEDKKFLSFSKQKVLFDAHASGSQDTYKRLSQKHLPRIKNAPSYDYLNKNNVIAVSTYPTPPFPYRNQKKEVDVSFCVGLQTHEVRPLIYEKLKELKKSTDYKIDLDKNKHNYRAYLRRVNISVNAPGYGEGSFRHLYTLNAKSFMLAHESIKQIKILPHADLIDGVDYISFNLSNLKDKIIYYLSHPIERKEIAYNGYLKYIQGYSIEKSAYIFLYNLINIIK